MVSSFKTTSHRKGESLYLNLMGDFDGSSAWKLLNLLKKNSKRFHRIIIHTNGLNNIYPFGVQTFHQNLSNLAKDQTRLLFTGEKANRISPKKDLCRCSTQQGNKESRMSRRQERDRAC